MPTFSREKLSGNSLGGHKAISVDGTLDTIHQTSTTSGVIEDVSLTVNNRRSAATEVTVREEQDGTLKHSFTKSIPGNSSVKLLDQVAYAHNMDIKIKENVDFSAYDVPGFVVGGSGGTWIYNNAWGNATLVRGVNSTKIEFDTLNGRILMAASSYVFVYGFDGSYIGFFNNGSQVENIFVFPAQGKIVINDSSYCCWSEYDPNDTSGWSFTDMNTSGIGSSQSMSLGYHGLHVIGSANTLHIYDPDAGFADGNEVFTQSMGVGGMADVVCNPKDTTGTILFLNKSTGSAYEWRFNGTALDGSVNAIGSSTYMLQGTIGDDGKLYLVGSANNPNLIVRTYKTSQSSYAIGAGNRAYSSVNQPYHGGSGIFIANVSGTNYLYWAREDGNGLGRYNLSNNTVDGITLNSTFGQANGSGIVPDFADWERIALDFNGHVNRMAP